jgi:bleomycin hydrolase
MMKNNGMTNLNWLVFAAMFWFLPCSPETWGQVEPPNSVVDSEHQAAEVQPTIESENKPAENKSLEPAESRPAEPQPYEFVIDANLETTDVKSQGLTGTCWCFATTSFIESELIRSGKGKHDLSEMFIVKNVYLDKANNFLRRQGKTNFGEGALAHDFIGAAGRHGLVPESVFDGLETATDSHDHAEMFSVLEGMLNGLVKRRHLSAQWPVAYERVTSAYLGDSPTEFSYDGQTFTPKSFAEYLQFDPKNYVNLTSFSHQPFGEPFVLEIPDNFSSGLFHNLPIDDLVTTIDRAISKGYTVAWDGDVSERGFSKSAGVAVLPSEGNQDFLRVPGPELAVSQQMRQQTYEGHTTTDDHLMHLVGIARDQNGTKYYLIKNSWGPVGKHDGYLYMSEAYVRLKTMAILVHRDIWQKPEGEHGPPKT